MGLGVAGGLVPTANPPCHDCRAQGVLGVPVGGLDRVGFEEKREGGDFDREIRPKLADAPSQADPRALSIDIVGAPRYRDAVRGDAPLLISVTDPKCTLQDPLNPWREAAVSTVADQGPTAAYRTRKTRLMERLLQAPIRCPTIADENALEVGAEERPPVPQIRAHPESRKSRCPGVAAVHGQCNCALDLPAGFIRRHPAAGDRLAALLAGRLRTAARRIAWTSPPGMIVRPKRSRNSVATFASGRPSCLFSTTASVTATGPSCALAVPIASDVCSGCRPCTRRRQSAQWANGEVERAHDRSHVREISLILHHVPRHGQPAPQSGQRAGSGAVWRSSACDEIGRRALRP